jgi:putative polyketide hydroxylase
LIPRGKAVLGMNLVSTPWVPILIVGAGAGGLAASALLAKHGVGSLVVEKRREVFIYPKARNLSFRSLEILRGLGLDEKVHAVADRVSDMVVKPTLNSADEKLAIDIDAVFAGLDQLSPEPSVQYCPQSSLEPMLLNETRQRGGEVRYGTELCSFEQDDSGVTAVLRDLDSDEYQAIRADYLVAADGVHSPIRNQLGVATAGYGALPIYVVFFYFRGPWRRFVSHLSDGDGIQVKNPDVDGIFLVAKDDLGMFITTYFPGKGQTAEQFTPEYCRDKLIKAIGEPIELEIIEAAAWQPYEQVADQFQCGRVFLVGDCGHTMPPFKAGGANTAIQSAHNLAWKLAAVLKGSADPALLSTFHAERHPVGRFAAHQSLTGPTVALIDLDDQGPGLPPEEEASMFSLLIGYQYRSAAVMADQPAPADPDAVSLVDELRGQPGTRVPHVWLHHGDRQVSTLDLLGAGFTLLTAEDGAAWAKAAAEASAALGVPIAVHQIGRSGDAVDPDGAWPQATGLAPGGALLVRPDDFVGWRADKLPADPEKQLHHALSAILARD